MEELSREQHALYIYNFFLLQNKHDRLSEWIVITCSDINTIYCNYSSADDHVHVVHGSEAEIGCAVAVYQGGRRGGEGGEEDEGGEEAPIPAVHGCLSF